MIASVLVALGSGAIDPSMVPQFSASDIAAVKAWWAVPGRFQANYQLAASEGGPYTAAPTSDGSTWLLAYYKALYPGQHILPDRDLEPTTAAQRKADSWLEARLEQDWSAAAEAARALNEGRSVPPPAPDDTPPELAATLGPAPKFAQPFRPRRYTVTFPDTVVYASDAVKTKRKFPYLRAVEGIDVHGSADGASFWQAALLRVKATAQASRVLQAVSSLEGGFDSVNTYDTGRVSVGVVQFASMADGRGSLGELLKAYKRDDRLGFQNVFRAYGIDITSSGTLAVLDPATGCEFQGWAAVRRIQRDKRLAAVFVRAGRVSPAFRAEQVHMALTLFWPGDRRLQWSVGGKQYAAKLSDVFRSDAGMATLLDRSVNSGDIGPVLIWLRDSAAQSGAKNVADLANQESRFIQSLKYRQDFSMVAGLSKPTELVASAPRPPLLPGTTIRPAEPEMWQPENKKPEPTKPKQPVRTLPEGADPKVAIPLGPPEEPRKPEDFVSPLKNEKIPKPGGG